MAAEDAVLRQLAPGDHVVFGNDTYGGTYRLICKVFGPTGITHSSHNLSESGDMAENWPANTKIVWDETPTNPLLSVEDIAALASVAHEHGAMLVIDNTFATLYLQQPIGHGADAVVHSTTKYLGGHSDVVGGFVATNDGELNDHLHLIQN